MYIKADDSVESREKGNGYIVLNYALIFKSEINFRVAESRCACSLILGTSCHDGSVSCILRTILLRFISWIMTRMLYRTSLSVLLSNMAGCR